MTGLLGFVRGQEGTWQKATPEERVERSQVAVPVFLTVMAKYIEETGEEFILNGTLIQRVMFYDLARARPAETSDGNARHTFEIRVNGEHDGQGVQLRKSRRVGVLAPSFTNSEGASAESVAWSETSSFELPLKLERLFDAQPFAIGSLSIEFELTSFEGNLTTRASTDAIPSSGKKVECKPDLLCHAHDNRNLLSVRDSKTSRVVDRMVSYSLLAPSPIVEFEIDSDEKSSTTWAPRMRVTWFVTANPTQAFMETVVPVIFVLICQTLNTSKLFDLDRGEILANSLTIGLTIAVITPMLRSASTRNDSYMGMTSNQVYLVWLYAGILGSMFGYRFEDSHPMTRQGLQAFMWAALCIPIGNGARYLQIKAKIKREMSKKDKGVNSFIGKPKPEKKGADEINADEVYQFHDTAASSKILSKHGWEILYDARTSLVKKAQSVRASSGILPAQIRGDEAFSQMQHFPDEHLTPERPKVQAMPTPHGNEEQGGGVLYDSDTGKVQM